MSHCCSQPQALDPQPCRALCSSSRNSQEATQSVHRPWVSVTAIRGSLSLAHWSAGNHRRQGGRTRAQLLSHSASCRRVRVSTKTAGLHVSEERTRRSPWVSPLTLLATSWPPGLTAPHSFTHSKTGKGWSLGTALWAEAAGHRGGEKAIQVSAQPQSRRPSRQHRSGGGGGGVGGAAAVDTLRPPPPVTERAFPPTTTNH